MGMIVFPVQVCKWINGNYIALTSQYNLRMLQEKWHQLKQVFILIQTPMLSLLFSLEMFIFVYFEVIPYQCTLE